MSAGRNAGCAGGEELRVGPSCSTNRDRKVVRIIAKAMEEPASEHKFTLLSLEHLEMEREKEREGNGSKVDNR